MGPPWECNNALESRGHMAPLKKQSSTFWVAPNCHQIVLPGFRATLQVHPRRCFESNIQEPLPACHNCKQVVSSCILCESRRHLTDLRVPQLHCVETVCPTNPTSCVLNRHLFFRERRHQIVTLSKVMVREKLRHRSQQATRFIKSRSTSCEGGVSPSTMDAHGSSNNEQKEEERVVSKSRLAAMNLSFSTRSSSTLNPIASEGLGMPTASGKPDSRMRVEPSSFNAASTSQVPLKGDLVL